MKQRTSLILVASLALVFAACDGDGDENNTSNNGQAITDASIDDAGTQDAGDSGMMADATDTDDSMDTGGTTDTGGADTGGGDMTDADGDGAVASVDCDDNDPLRAPGFTEGCDAIDRDCDGTAVEADTVSFFPASGDDPVVLTDELAGASLANPAELTVTEDGELRFCEGDFAVGVAAGTHAVTITGDDQTTTTLEATGGACPIESEGDLSVRDMTLVGRDSDCLAVIQGHGPTLEVQDVTIRDHEVTGYGAAAISIGSQTSATIERSTIEDITQALFADVTSGSTCVFDIDDLTISGQAVQSELWCEAGSTLRNVTLQRSTQGFQVWSNITLDGITLDGNGTAASPAETLMQMRRAGNVVINNLVVTNNVSDRGIIELLADISGGAGDITLTNSEFRNNSGQGILGLGAETLSVRDVVVSDNESGVTQVINIFSEGLASVEFHNLTVENNTGERSALQKSTRDAVTPTFTGTNVFRNNTIDGFGGAIQWFAEANTTIDLSAVTFEGNSATGDAGAVRLTSGSFGTPVTIRGGTYRNNSSGANGGAIGVAGHNLTVEGGTFEGNTAGRHGGAIYSENLVAVDGGTFTDNSAANGGAIQGKFQIPGANVTVSNATFLRNSASVAGGVVDLRPTATTTIGNVDFNACTFGTGADANTPGDVHLGGSASPSHQTPSGGTGTCNLGNQCD